MSTSPIITVVTKETPGGRCQLYLSYAAALATALMAEVKSIVGPEAPALFVNGSAVVPEDGVILTADEIHVALMETGFQLPQNIFEILEGVEEEFMTGLA
ncbi:MAG: hypothetical protein NUV50_10430 [Rhodospirillales bacterium]|nr:hypothetical protein [Rhodospirillales bacterium]